MKKMDIAREERQFLIATLSEASLIVKILRSIESHQDRIELLVDDERARCQMLADEIENQGNRILCRYGKFFLAESLKVKNKNESE